MHMLNCFHDSREYYIKFNKIRYPKDIISLTILNIKVVWYMLTWRYK